MKTCIVYVEKTLVAVVLARFQDDSSLLNNQINKLFQKETIVYVKKSSSTILSGNHLSLVSDCKIYKNAHRETKTVE